MSKNMFRKSDYFVKTRSVWWRHGLVIKLAYWCTCTDNLSLERKERQILYGEGDLVTFFIWKNCIFIYPILVALSPLSVITNARKIRMGGFVYKPSAPQVVFFILPWISVIRLHYMVLKTLQWNLAFKKASTFIKPITSSSFFWLLR